MVHRDAHATPSPIRLVEFTKAFWLGGTECQVVELLRGLGPGYEISVAVLDEVGPLVGEVRSLGFLPRAFPLRGSFLSVNTARQIKRMAGWLRDTGAELVHAHDFYSTLVGVPAARLAGVKVVVGRLDLLHWHGPSRSAALGMLSRAADGVVVNAEAVRQSCLAQGIPGERMTLIRNGLDLPRFDARLALPPDAPVPEVGTSPAVVQVANMSHVVKRQEDLLQALARVREQVGSVHAFFVGDGCRRPQLEELARRLKLENLAHFLGFRTDIPAILARASVGVLCSDVEGLSNAIIEGMAARLPMVVTRVGGNPELVTDGERGLLVEPRRPDQLADAIAGLVTDHARARRLGIAGRDFVERELTAAHLVERHDRWYRRIARPKETPDRSNATIGTCIRA